MEATSSTISISRVVAPALTATTLRRWLALFAVSLIAATAVVLLARRIAGALAEPLSALPLIATAAILVGTAAAIRTQVQQRSIAVLLSAGLIAIATSLTLPGSSWLGLIVLWLSVVGEEVWAWRPRDVRPANHIDVAWRHAVDLPDSPKPQLVAPKLSLVDEIADATEPWTDEATPADWTNSNLTQQLNYRRTAEGMSIEGWARAEFADGQRTATLHTAFCPAFSRAPQVEGEPLDGPDCEIVPTVTLPWGVRWEVKLDRAAKEATSVVLGFFAAEQTDT
jgi:hypothetical protein